MYRVNHGWYIRIVSVGSVFRLISNSDTSCQCSDELNRDLGNDNEGRHNLV